MLFWNQLIYWNVCVISFEMAGVVEVAVHLVCEVDFCFERGTMDDGWVVQLVSTNVIALVVRPGYSFLLLIDPVQLERPAAQGLCFTLYVCS